MIIVSHHDIRDNVKKAPAPRTGIILEGVAPGGGWQRSEEDPSAESVRESEREDHAVCACVRGSAEKKQDWEDTL